MYEELKSELRRQAERSGGTCRDHNPEGDMVKFDGVIDLRFLAGCLRDTFWADLTDKLKRL